MFNASHPYLIEYNQSGWTNIIAIIYFIMNFAIFVEDFR